MEKRLLKKQEPSMNMNPLYKSKEVVWDVISMLFSVIVE
jgi:hypothetical protein